MAEKPSRSFRLSEACLESVRWIAEQMGLSDAAVIELAVVKLRKDGIPGFLEPPDPKANLADYLSPPPPLQEPPLRRTRGRPPSHQEKPAPKKRGRKGSP